MSLTPPLIRKLSQIRDVDPSGRSDGWFLQWDETAQKHVFAEVTLATLGAEAVGVAAGLVSAHEAAVDPHPQYANAAAVAASLAAKADLVGGVVPSSQLPALVVTDVYTVPDEAAMVALAAEQGDLAIRADGAGTFVRNAGDAGNATDWTLLNVPTAPVTSVNGLIGAVTLGYADVGAMPATATTADVAESSGRRYLTDAQQSALQAVAAEVSGTLLRSTGGGLGILHPTYNILDGEPQTPMASVVGINIDGTLRHVTGVADRKVLIGESDSVFGWATLGTGDITGLQTALAGKLAAASNLSDVASVRAACANLRTWHVLAGSAAGTTPLTGTTDETAVVSIAIPAGAMGPNGILRITLTLSYTSSANNKTFRLRFGAANDLSGTAFLQRTETTLRRFSDVRSIMNRGSASSQIGSTGVGNGAFGSFNVANVTSAVNTAQTSYLIISGQLANSGEQFVVESYLVEVMYGA